MSATLSPKVAAGHRGHNRVPVVALVVAIIAMVVLGVLLLVGERPVEQPVSLPAAYAAQARAGTTSAELLRLEGQIVGSGAVVLPGKRGPDVAAFHRVGVAAMSIDGTSLTVTFLADATRAQLDRVRSILESSPLIESVSPTG